MVLHERSLCDMITRLRLGREIVLGVLPSVNLQFFVKKEGWGEREGGLIYREGGINSPPLKRGGGIREGGLHRGFRVRLQVMTLRSGEGGGYSQTFRIGVCRQGSLNPDRSQGSCRST